MDSYIAMRPNSDDPPLVEAEVMEDGQLTPAYRVPPVVAIPTTTLSFSQHNDKQALQTPVPGYSISRNDVCSLEVPTMGNALPRPALLSALVQVDTAREPSLGIQLTETNDGETRVEAIDPSGPIHQTLFRTGDIVVSVNGVRCKGRNSGSVADLLALPDENNHVLIVVQNDSPDAASGQVAATIPRPPTKRIGIQMKHTRAGYMRISGIHDDSLLASSILNVGDSVVSVNGVSCYAMHPQYVLALLKEQVPYMTIVARTKPEKGVVLSTYRSSTSFGNESCPEALADVSQHSLQEHDRPNLASGKCTWLCIASILVILGLLNLLVTRLAGHWCRRPPYDISLSCRFRCRGEPPSVTH